MSPVLNNTNPLIDLRSKFDDFYHVRSAEWSGFYPTDMTATPDCITDEYRRMIDQLLPKHSDLKTLAQVNKARKIEIDLSFLNLA